MLKRTSISFDAPGIFLASEVLQHFLNWRGIRRLVCSGYMPLRRNDRMSEGGLSVRIRYEHKKKALAIESVSLD
jgi:hypothetical protein